MAARKRKRDADRSQRSRADRASRKSWTRLWLLALAAVVGLGATLVLLGLLLIPDERARATADLAQQSVAPKAATSSLQPVAQEPPDTVETAQSEALQTASRLVDRYERNPEAWSVLAQLHVKLSNAAEAEECWHKCLALKPDFLKAYLGLAAAAEAKADNGAAVVALRQARKIDPSSSDVRHRLANLLLQQAQIDEAVALLRENTQHNPQSHQDWSLLGEAYTQAKDFAQAKECLEKAIAIDAAQPDAHYMLARACARLGLRDQAAEHQQDFASLQAAREKERRQNNLSRTDLGEMCETAAITCLGAGDVYASQGDLSVAEHHWLRAAIIDPAATGPRQRLASFYLQAGRTDDAIRVHKELVRIEPQNVLNHVNLGTVLAGSRQITAAEKAFAEVVRLAPEQAIGHVCLAKLAMQSGRKVSQAWQHARKAVRLEPTAINYALLAAVSEANGDLPGACDAARHAAELEPENPRFLELYRRYDK